MCTRAIWRTLVGPVSFSSSRITLIASLGSVVTTNVDSARGNLAGTFVNAFVNAGFGNDKLMVQADEGSAWIYKNKDHGKHIGFSVIIVIDSTTTPGMMSAAASLGLSLLWDADVGLSHVDKYTYSAEEYIKVSSSCPRVCAAIRTSIRQVLFLRTVSSTVVSSLRQTRSSLS